MYVLRRHAFPPRPCAPSQVAPLLSDLKKYWPSYDAADNTFWAHEYEKHGTCAASIPQLNTQFKFFQQTLALTKQYNAIPMLAQSNIKPSDTKTVATSAAQNAIKAAFGGVPAFTCKSGNLDSVYLCFNKSLQPINCNGLKNTCGTSFYIPATQQVFDESDAHPAVASA